MQIKFGTSGWRGIIGRDFTLENLVLVTQAIANYLKKTNQAKQGLIVGYDTRFMSREFAEMAANILQQNNIPVFLTDRDTPTPAIAFHIIKRHTAGAINITASHNPSEYNGVKFSTAYGGPASAEVTKEIEREIKNVRLSKVKSSKLNVFNPKPEYIKHVLKLIDLEIIKKAKLKIVLDCMYGTSREYLDHILNKGGVKLNVLHNSIDPLFGGEAPDTKEKNLTELSNIVKKNRSHLGLATDGDGDRFGIIDRDGSYISANNTLALILDHLFKTRSYKGGVVRSITTTHLLDAIAKKFNREIYEVPVGFKYVGSTLLEKGAVMGGEESGGMTVFGHIPEKDGILACLLITELVAYHRKSLKEILKGLQTEYGSFYNKRIDIRVCSEKKDAILKRFKKRPLNKFAGLNVIKYLRLKDNNFRFILADGSWIIIRPSGTEPIIRCYIETGTKKALILLENNLKSLMGGLYGKN